MNGWVYLGYHHLGHGGEDRSDECFRPILCFSHKDRQSSTFFQLLPDGSIRDIDSPGHDNERFWDFQNNQICLYSNQRQLTATFDCCYEEEGHSYWEGWHQHSIPLELRLI